MEIKPLNTSRWDAEAEELEEKETFAVVAATTACWGGCCYVCDFIQCTLLFN